MDKSCLYCGAETQKGNYCQYEHKLLTERIKITVEMAKKAERKFYRQYFTERINIIQKLLATLPEVQGQSLLKKIMV